MNKNELIKQIHENSPYKYDDIKEITNLVFKTILEGLIKDEKVSIHEFGTFDLVYQKAYTGVSPVDGSKITVSGKNKIRFSSSKNLKEAINEK